MEQKPAAGPRVASVEWVRILVAVCVVVGHYIAFCGDGAGFAPSAAVIVDFFFVLSGFLLLKGLDKPPAPGAPRPPLPDTLLYVFRKARGLYPEYLTAFLLMFGLHIFLVPLVTAGQILQSFFHYKWELLLLQMAGFNPHPAFNTDYLVGSAWYLSSMLLMMIPAYYLARYHRRAYVNFIAPLAALFIYGYIMQAHGNLDVGNEVVGFILLGNLRAFAGLGVGGMAFALYRHANAAGWTVKARRAACCIEAFCLLSIPALFLLGSYISAPGSLFWVPIWAALLFLAFSNQTPVLGFLNRRFTRAAAYLGRLSLYLYLFHWFFVNLFARYLAWLGFWPGLLLYLAVVVLFCAAAMWLFTKWRLRGAKA